MTTAAMSLLCSEHELLKGEVVAVKAAKDKLNARVVELEEETRKYKEAVELHKQRSPSEDDVRTLFSSFSVTVDSTFCGGLVAS